MDRPGVPGFRVPPAVAGRRLDVIAIGSFLAEQVVHVDRHPGGGGQGSIPIRAMTSSTGGGAANVAAIGARLGGRMALLGVTGDGPRSAAVLATLHDAGVDTAAVAVRQGHDADLLVLLADRAGDWVALEQLDPALRLTIEDVESDVPFADAAWLHVDGYSHFTAGSQEVVDRAVDRARAAGCLVSVDAAVPSTLADPGFVRSLVGRADLACCNRTEAEALTGVTDDDAAVDALLALGAAVVVLKRGAEGSLVATADGRAALPAFPTEVVDTLAAGDAYVAATLVGLTRGLPLVEAARRGAAAGALACRTPGSQGGTFGARDVDAILASRPAAPADDDESAPPTTVAVPFPAFVLVPGSERRVERFAALLDGARTVSHEGEHLLVTGSLDGIPLAVCSTGIGGHGVAQVVDMLAARGATTFIRVGVTGAIPLHVRTGELIVASAAVRMDGTSDNHVDPAYPAVGDHAVTAALVAAAQAAGATVHTGIGATASSFYAGEGIPGFGGFVSAPMAGIEAEMRAAGVLDWDTETATLFAIARRRGLRAGRLNVVVDDRETGRYDPVGEPRGIEVVLEAVRLLARWDAEGRTWGAHADITAAPADGVRR